MAPMEARVSKETLTALKTDLTLRCLLTAHFNHKSRHSKDVISWAYSRAEKVSSLLLQDIGQPTPEFNLQINIIQMLHPSSKVFICFDIFLPECDKHLEDEIRRGYTFKRPMHQIVRRGDIYHITRNKELEQVVAEQYADMRQHDLGPLPLFSDYQNPPLYIDGRRVEDWDEEHGPGEPDEVNQSSSPNVGDGGTEDQPASNETSK